jgi:hypothetical protein
MISALRASFSSGKSPSRLAIPEAIFSASPAPTLRSRAT